MNVYNFCTKCNCVREDNPNDITRCFKCNTLLELVASAYVAPLTPCVSLIRNAARSVGYAIGEHGSTVRDLDLIAVPWTVDAVGTKEFLMYILGYLKGKIVSSSVKPHGRIAVSIQLEGNYKLIDLSVVTIK